VDLQSRSDCHRADNVRLGLRVLSIAEIVGYERPAGSSCLPFLAVLWHLKSGRGTVSDAAPLSWCRPCAVRHYSGTRLVCRSVLETPARIRLGVLVSGSMPGFICGSASTHETRSDWYQYGPNHGASATDFGRRRVRTPRARGLRSSETANAGYSFVSGLSEVGRKLRLSNIHSRMCVQVLRNAAIGELEYRKAFGTSGTAPGLRRAHYVRSSALEGTVPLV
jgi:hypothetical protein